MESILKLFVNCIIIVYIFSLLCHFIIWRVADFYSVFQEFLLRRSSYKNQALVGKLLVLNYRVCRKLFYFLCRIQPFSLGKDIESDCFNAKILSATKKRNLSWIGRCFGLSLIINFIRKYEDNIMEIFSEVFQNETALTVNEFIEEYMWLIIASIGALSLLYRFYKDRFINKIILDIQEDALRDILHTHMRVWNDFVRLQDVLCENVQLFFEMYKVNGKLFVMSNDISNLYSKYEYDIDKDTFKVGQNVNWSSGRDEGYGFKEITDLTEKLKANIQKFMDTEPFYSTSAISKYEKKLIGFDITYRVKNRDEKCLLCKEYILGIYDKCRETLDDVLMDVELSDDYKIQRLNMLYQEKNNGLLYVTKRTIEYIVELDIYIASLKRLLALKTRRSDLPIDELIKKYER